MDCFVSTAVASQAELSEEAALGESAGIHGNGVTHILSVQEVKKCSGAERHGKMKGKESQDVDS